MEHHSPQVSPSSTALLHIPFRTVSLQFLSSVVIPKFTQLLNSRSKPLTAYNVPQTPLKEALSWSHHVTQNEKDQKISSYRQPTAPLNTTGPDCMHCITTIRWHHGFTCNHHLWITMSTMNDVNKNAICLNATGRRHIHMVWCPLPLCHSLPSCCFLLVMLQMWSPSNDNHSWESFIILMTFVWIQQQMATAPSMGWMLTEPDDLLGPCPSTTTPMAEGRQHAALEMMLSTNIIIFDMLPHLLLGTNSTCASSCGPVVWLSLCMLDWLIACLCFSFKALLQTLHLVQKSLPCKIDERWDVHLLWSCDWSIDTVASVKMKWYMQSETCQCQRILHHNHFESIERPKHCDHVLSETSLRLVVPTIWSKRMQMGGWFAAICERRWMIVESHRKIEPQTCTSCTGTCREKFWESCWWTVMFMQVEGCRKMTVDSRTEWSWKKLTIPKNVKLWRPSSTVQGSLLKAATRDGKSKVCNNVLWKITTWCGWSMVVTAWGIGWHHDQANGLVCDDTTAWKARRRMCWGDNTMAPKDTDTWLQQHNSVMCGTGKQQPSSATRKKNQFVSVNTTAPKERATATTQSCIALRNGCKDIGTMMWHKQQHTRRQQKCEKTTLAQQGHQPREIAPVGHMRDTMRQWKVASDNNVKLNIILTFNGKGNEHSMWDTKFESHAHINGFREAMKETINGELTTWWQSCWVEQNEDEREGRSKWCHWKIAFNQEWSEETEVNGKQLIATLTRNALAMLESAMTTEGKDKKKDSALDDLEEAMRDSWQITCGDERNYDEDCDEMTFVTIRRINARWSTTLACLGHM